MSDRPARPLLDDEGRVVCERCAVASSFTARVRGLLGRKSLPANEGLMITKTSSIHTAFMAFAIDAVFLDRDLRVRKVVPDLRPFRVAFCWGAKSVLELPAGAAARAGIEVGRRLAWQDHR